MPGKPDIADDKKSRRGRKAEDLKGRTFGNLTVLERTENTGGRSMWSCRCSCGNLTTATGKELKSGNKKSCGCLKKQRGRKLDITGRRYGKLTVICPTDKRNPRGSVIWKCRCDCGNETEASVAELNSGKCKSCGCLKEESKRSLHDRLHLVDGTCVEWLEGRRGRTDNTSGFRGVYKKKNGKYSVSIGFRKKVLFIGIFDLYQDAVDARLRAEHLVHEGFLAAHRMWKSMAEQDPKWEEANPFRFDVTKEDGRLVIHSSMERFMHIETESTSGLGGSMTDSFSGIQKEPETTFPYAGKAGIEERDTSGLVPANGVYRQSQARENERELVPT